jgi:hypothetical protein
MTTITRHSADDELAELRKMTTARIRRCYDICQQQLSATHKSGRRDLDEAARDLYAWQMAYADELVRRGVRA